jgi:HEAT repeat protein
MTDSPDPRELSPFARSIVSIFEGEPTPPVEAPAASELPEDVADEALEATPAAAPEAASSSGGEADELKRAVAAYLASAEGQGRADAVEEVRSAYAAAKRAQSIEPQADAVAALARVGRIRPEALWLARELVGPVVAASLVRKALYGPPESRDDRVALLGALGEEGVRAVADVLHGADDRRERSALVVMLSEVAPSAPSVIDEMIDDGRWFVVRNAVHVLGEVGDPAALEHLTGTIAHEDARVRRESILSLQKIGSEDAAPLVLARLEDEDAAVRASAARAVGALGIDRGLRSLVALLEEKDEEEVITAACRALGAIGDPAAVPVLEKKAKGGFLSKPSPEIRIAAYHGLAAIGTPHATRLLDEAESDRDADVRSAVKAARRRRG